MRRGLRGGVVAAVLSVAVALALARPALGDDVNAGVQCRAVHHGTDEFAVCLYLDVPDFDDLPAVAPAEARSALDAFLAAPDDAVCVKTAANEKPFVECYFSREIFEADEGNPAWTTMGPESELAQAVLYSPNELKPLDSTEPPPTASPAAMPVAPEASPVLPESTPSPAPAPSDVPTTTSPQPSEIPNPEPSTSPTDVAE
jgi:hypothetical protein